MKSLFWICWSVEITAALLWIISEMKQPYISPNPWAFIIALYLVIVLAVRFGFDAHRISVVLVTLPAAPVVLLGLLFSYMPYREVAAIKN
jgi:hypothetical protein